MPTTPHLTAGIRTMPEHMTSPGYRNFLTWLGGQELHLQGHVYEWETAASLPPGERVYATYKTVTLWDDPIRGVVAVYDLNPRAASRDRGRCLRHQRRSVCRTSMRSCVPRLARRSPDCIARSARR